MARRCPDMSEQDVIYGKDIYCWVQRAGARHWWKRRMRRRERREGKTQAHGECEW